MGTRHFCDGCEEVQIYPDSLRRVNLEFLAEDHSWSTHQSFDLCHVCFDKFKLKLPPYKK